MFLLNSFVFICSGGSTTSWKGRGIKVYIRWIYLSSFFATQGSFRIRPPKKSPNKASRATAGKENQGKVKTHKVFTYFTYLFVVSLYVFPCCSWPGPRRGVRGMVYHDPPGCPRACLDLLRTFFAGILIFCLHLHFKFSIECHSKSSFSRSRSMGSEPGIHEHLGKEGWAE